MPPGRFVNRGQKLSHYRGQIEPPSPLPSEALVNQFSALLSIEAGVETQKNHGSTLTAEDGKPPPQSLSP